MLQLQLQQPFAARNHGDMDAGERFANLRKARGYGQKSLADLAGMKSDQAISNFEQGRSNKMQPDNWRKIAEVLGMSLAELNEAVYGDTVVMSVPVGIVNYVSAMIEKFKDQKPVLHGVVVDDDPSLETEKPASRGVGRRKPPARRRKREKNGKQ